jgi:CubicO group peptidase (beta-lactamase class C family)/tetratricopeptide (TPR) repeat protein
MRTRLQLSLAVLLIAISILGAAAAPPEENLARYAEVSPSFEGFVVRQMAFDGVPGLTVGFIKDNFVWVKGFGFADLENQLPAKPESSYRLASITKTITAVAVLQLVEEGKIDLDSEIQTYVPDFPRKKWPVTVRQLLGHIGGISHYRNYSVEGRIREPRDTQQSLAIFKDFDLVAEPGTRYNYSTYGYNLLGAAVEGASGVSYGEYIRTHIFEPLDMSDSRLDDARDLIPNRVKGYQFVDGKLQNSEFVDVSSRFAGGGVRSTIPDLLNYARGIIDGKLLKEPSWKKMFAPMALRNGLLTGYGMGWFVQPLNGHFVVSHSGSQPETRTHLVIFPREKFAVAIACNLEGTNLIPYITRLVEATLEEDIDSTAYASDSARQLIFSAVSQVYGYGLSSYEWTNQPLAKSWNDLDDAFAYFNDCVNERKIRRDFTASRKKVLLGTHLAANQAFTKVGAYMARVLEEDGGTDRLLSFHKRGPVAFFSDYIRLVEGPSAPKRHPRFKSEFINLMAEWENDWNKTYTDDVRRLVLTSDTDFDVLMPKLVETFAGAAFYPDFTADLARLADSYLRKNNPDEAIAILSHGRELYPDSALLLAMFGKAYLGRGDRETGVSFYRKSYESDSTHPLISVDELSRTGSWLVRANRLKEAISLGELAVEFYPREATLYVELANLSLLAGKRDQAVEYLKKALKIDPKLEEARIRLKSMEKKGGAS